jgi:hypothetical protein
MIAFFACQELFSGRYLPHAIAADPTTIQRSLAGCSKRLRGVRGNGVLEYGNIEILGLKRINPSFHPSIIPILLRWSEAMERNEAYEFFFSSSLLGRYGLTLPFFVYNVFAHRAAETRRIYASNRSRFNRI